jgi:hypothetical protein
MVPTGSSSKISTKPLDARAEREASVAAAAAKLEVRNSRRRIMSNLPCQVPSF